MTRRSLVVAPAFRLALALLLSCVGASVPAAAATLQALSPEQLWTLADVVAVVEVSSTTTRQTPAGRIVTQVALEVSEPLKGTAAGASLLLVLPGGTVGDLTQRVPGVPQVEAGDTALVYLERAGDRAFRLVGLEQGWLYVAPDADGSGGWIIERSRQGRYMTPGSDGRLNDSPAPAAREPLTPYLDRLRRMPGATR